jgi:hypothetical protein
MTRAFGVELSTVKRSPAPTESSSGEHTKNGQYRPTLEMMAPDSPAPTTVLSMYGKMSSPDLVAVTPLVAWYHSGR